MIPALRPINFGGLRDFSHTLVLPDDPRPGIPGPHLLDAQVMDRLLSAAAAHIGEGDLRARMSLWSIDYVHYLMPLPVVASLVLNRQLAVGLEDIELIVDDEAMPAAIRLRDGGRFRLGRDPYVNFAPMIRGHLEPLFAAWAAFSGLSPRVFWANAGNLYEAIVSGLERTPVLPSRLTRRARHLISDEQWPDGWRNPLRNPVLYRPDRPNMQRWRRVCCVRYLIPRYNYCSNCPHRLTPRPAEAAPAS